MTFVKINGVEYQAEIYGLERDGSWDDRQSKNIITSELTYEQAKELFFDGCSWSIIVRNTDSDTLDEYYEEEFDNSDFNIPGPIVDFRDGRVSIKMGKQTDLEQAYELLYGSTN